MDLETIWYEYAPYLYLIAGIVTIDQVGSLFGFCVGGSLLAGALVMLALRWHHRVRARHEHINSD